MPTLILNVDIAERNIQVDLAIISFFQAYCIQYSTIPTRLYLADPSLAAHKAFVIVDTSQRMYDQGSQAPRITIGFYHPEHVSPLYIHTDNRFEYILGASSDSPEWGEFLFEDDGMGDSQPEHYFERLIEKYPPFSRLSDTLAKERIRRFTIPFETLNFG